MALTTLRSRACEFCGRPIEPQSLTFGGRTYTTPSVCNCDGARAQQEADELAERRRRASELAEQRQRIYRKAGIKPRFMGAEPDATHLAHVDAGHGLYLVGDTNAGRPTRPAPC